MARRLQPTLIDYVVIAINPALIMVLVGSLIYFLLEMFYQGEYPERLHFCLTMFIFAAVLIARISMEEGWEHAAPFGVALAVAIFLAMLRFVTYRNPTLALFGWLLNCGLIALAWWCANKLTWDCTLMDDSQDASGEGLLQTVGLDSQDEEAEKGAKGKSALKSPGGEKSSPKPTEPPDSILPPESVSKTGKSWWQRFLERRRRPHAPGVWVVYFSLAALPLFGLGQAFIPLAKTGSRRYAFVLLCLYVASGLGLLLTTSFLGLRRYLRQRRLEMPLPMAGTWLVTGAVLIVGLLFLTALLPRPNAEYEISELPFADSEQHDSSPISAGKEGVKDDSAKSAPGQYSRPKNQDSQPPEKQSQSAGGEDRNSRAEGPQSKTGKANPENSKSGESKSSDAKSGESKSGESKAGGSKAGESKSGESKSTDGKLRETKSGESKSGESKGNEAKPADAKPSEAKPNDAKSREPKAPGTKSSEPKSPDASPKPSQPPRTPPGPDPNLAVNLLANLTKVVFYCVLIGIVLWWLIFHWQVLLIWLQALLNGWRDLWANLFGRRKTAEDASAPSAAQHKSFSDYADPFAAGVAGRYSPVELVRYSFEALEAWARDNGFPREPDQTVHDFARQIADHVEPLAAPARTLAELYNWAAYSPRTLPKSTSMEPVREFWKALLRADRKRSAAKQHASVD